MNDFRTGSRDSKINQEACDMASLRMQPVPPNNEARTRIAYPQLTSRPVNKFMRPQNQALGTINSEQIDMVGSQGVDV